jgi:hypothetical protein
MCGGGGGLTPNYDRGWRGVREEKREEEIQDDLSGATLARKRLK